MGDAMRLSVRITPELYSQLQALAEAEKRSFSDVVRMKLRQAVARRQPKEQEAPVKGVAADFAAFWKVWPNKVGRQAAYNAFKKRVKLDEAFPSVETLVAIVQKQTRDLEWRERPKYCPHASTWLNQRRFIDKTQPIRDKSEKRTNPVPARWNP